MNFVGKILIVLQVILSVLFMAFAGAVYSAHMNWRAEAEKTKANLTKKEAEARDLSNQLETTKTELTARITAADANAKTSAADNKGLQQEIDRLKKEVADLKVASKTASEQALIAGQDAAARKTEADNLRAINHELTVKRDEEFGERLKLEDTRRNLELALEVAARKQKESLGKIAILQEALAANGITADVSQLAARSSPPPAVDGKVMVVKSAKRSGESEHIELSLGSDDGLKLGHELTVFRSALQGGDEKAKYLARIRIVDVTPDRAVGQVIETTRNGVIRKGDNVTTKL